MENVQLKKIKDVNFSEGIMLGVLCFTVLLFGFYPEVLTETIKVSVDNLINNYKTEIAKTIIFK